MTEESYQTTWIVLNAVKSLNVGKYKLAEFLKGSKSKDVSHLSNQQGYGGLLWCDISTIIGFIEQLEQMKLITRIKPAIDEYYSVLELTEAGKKVLDEKINIEEIAKSRNLAVSTIYDHLYKLVANGYLSCSEFVPENLIKQIIKAKSGLPNAAKLKEIKEMLPEEISYNEIKCVLADKNISM